MPVSRLTQFQRDVLLKFFEREQRFFLTGGAALAGFHLGHRETDDLDLFTAGHAEVLDQGMQVLRKVAQGLDATLRVESDYPNFKRVFVCRGALELKVELAHDPYQAFPKVQLEGITLDSAQEILANKLTTLLGRGEIRDLVDIMKLEEAGHRIEDALPVAAQKDLGLTPGNLVFVLSDINIGPDARIPGGVSNQEIREYLERLIDRLARLAFPHGK